MYGTVRKFRSLGFGAVALCLTATFGLTVSGANCADRVNRSQQRTRANRNTRLRVCHSVFQEPCSLQAAFVNSYHFALPPALAPEAERPATAFIEGIVLPGAATPRPAPVLSDSLLPRPPPSAA